MLSGYSPKGPCLHLGAALLNGSVQQDVAIKIPLKTLNRHGLIAGATGTGKSVSLQLLAEDLCKQGVPVLLMDLKGDLSGIAQPGKAGSKAEARQRELGLPFEPAASSVEFFSLSTAAGVRLKATVSEFGPVLFSKILGLNDTQAGIVAILFRYADQRQLPLLDLKDVKQLLNYATNQGKAELQKEYGAISASSVSIILRKIIELETQGAERFFGEPSFEVKDLLRVDEQGHGIASVIRLQDMLGQAKLFSSFMLCLLAEVYDSFPEEGDLEKPKLCIFIEEAHLLFKDASSALLEQIETIIKLIRSKGVGIFFVTQSPDDIPQAVLGQLGLKLQHALRAFTEKDRKAIKKAAENYPVSDFYKTDQLLTSLGIGQALVSALDEKGIPTPLVAVHLKAPASRIGSLNDAELQDLISKSGLIQKYNQDLDRESAYELLKEKMEDPVLAESPTSGKQKPRAGEKSVLEKAGSSPLAKQIGRTVARELTRGLLGVLGIGRNRKKSWF